MCIHIYIYYSRLGYLIVTLRLWHSGHKTCSDQKKGSTATSPWASLQKMEESWPSTDVGFSTNGETLKWMVYKEKSQSKMDDDWGYPYLWKPACPQCLGTQTWVLNCTSALKRTVSTPTSSVLGGSTWRSSSSLMWNVDWNRKEWELLQLFCQTVVWCGLMVSFLMSPLFIFGRHQTKRARNRTWALPLHIIDVHHLGPRPVKVFFVVLPICCTIHHILGCLPAHASATL